MLTEPTGEPRGSLPGGHDAAAREDRLSRLVAARTSARDRRFGTAGTTAAERDPRAQRAPFAELETPTPSVRATGLRGLMARLRQRP